MKNILTKSIVLSLFISSLLPILAIKATDRDIDLFDDEWANLARKVVVLRDEKAHLIQENKRLEATIDQRSLAKGLSQGRLEGAIGGVIGTGITFAVIVALLKSGKSGNYSRHR